MVETWLIAGFSDGYMYDARMIQGEPADLENFVQLYKGQHSSVRVISKTPHIVVVSANDLVVQLLQERAELMEASKLAQLRFKDIDAELKKVGFQ